MFPMEKWQKVLIVILLIMGGIFGIIGLISTIVHMTDVGNSKVTLFCIWYCLAGGCGILAFLLDEIFTH